MRFLLRTGSSLGWICLFVGLLQQAFVKDYAVGTALLFYALPKPCLLLLAATLLVWPRASRPTRIAAGILTLLIGGWWIAVSWGHGPSASVVADSREGDIKVLFWNLNRSPGIDLDMVALVQEFQPHLAAFVEPGPKAKSLCADYEKRLPGYKAEFVPGGLLLLSRVTASFRDRGPLDRVGAFATFEVTGLGPAFPLVIADVYAKPFRSRGHQLHQLLSQVRGRTDTIVAGDFNTPSESAHFENYHAHLQDALATAGHGFRETWPLGLPLLSIDHVWVGTDWQILEARQVHRWSSDHNAILVKLRRK